jgi:hypothetical protein
MAKGAAMTTEPNFETNRELDPCAELRKRLEALLEEMERATKVQNPAMHVVTQYWAKKLKEAMNG